MITWTQLKNYYPLEQQNMIAALQEEYYELFGESLAETFYTRTEDQLFADIHSIINPVASGSVAFLSALGAMLKEKAATDGIDNYEDFLQLFEAIDRPYIADLILYLKDDGKQFSYFQATITVDMLVAKLKSLTFPYTFWENFIRSLKLRIEKLEEINSVENEQESFLALFSFDERTTAEPVIQYLYDAETLFSIYNLSKRVPRLLATAFIPESGFIEPEAYLFLSRLQKTQANNYTNADFLQALINLYPSEMQVGIKELFNELLKAEGIETASQLMANLAEQTNNGLDLIIEFIEIIPSNHPYLQGLAAWLIQKAQVFVRENEVITEMPVQVMLRQQITAMLVDEVNNVPLPNYLVEIVDSTNEEEVVIAKNITQAYGLFEFSFEQHITETESEVVPGNTQVIFKIYNLKSELLTQTQAITIAPNEDKLTVSVTVPAETIPEISLTALSEVLSTTAEPIAIPETFNGTTLEDIRQAGGFESIMEVSTEEQAALAERLNAHATYEVFSPDLAFNDQVIMAGYTDFAKIAETPRHEFVEQFNSEGEVKAVVFYQQAANIQALLKLDATALLSARASGYTSDEELSDQSIGSNLRSGANYSNLVARLVANKCNCDDCETAVSPIAYLASLLDYTSNKLKFKNLPDPNNTNPALKVTIVKFEELFHQPFNELLASCDLMSERVCQTRIAVDVVRHYMKSKNLSDITFEQKKTYLKEVYAGLLQSLGISYEELRHAGDEALNKLAKRTGLEKDFIKNRLFLKDTAAPYLTEDNLELLFGLQSTLRNPLSIGFKLKDDNTLNDTMLTRWEFSGYEWQRSTDDAGYTYVSIDRPAQKVYIHRHSSRAAQYLVASGNLASPNLAISDQKLVILLPENDSDLYGHLYFEFGASSDLAINANKLKVSLIPEVTANKLKVLRELWMQEDNLPTNNRYLLPQAANTIVIDPDIMSPDDIRGWEDTGSLGATICTIWQNRIKVLDQWYNIFNDKRNAPYNVRQMLEAGINDSIIYRDNTNAPITVPRWNLAEIADEYGGYDTDSILALVKDIYRVKQIAAPGGAIDLDATELITERLGFSMESFYRVHELLLKYEKFLADIFVNPPVTEEELTELVNLLTVSVKNKLFTTWKNEENDPDLNINLDPALFYLPITDPTEGEWNARPDASQFGVASAPLIDPEIQSRKALPDVTNNGSYGYGFVALGRWNMRKEQLATKKQHILDALVTGTEDRLSERMVWEAYKVWPGNPSDTPGLPAFETLIPAYSNEADPGHADAINYVHEELALTDEEFTVLLVLREKEDNPSAKITEPEWTKLANILTTAWKRKVAYRFVDPNYDPNSNSIPANAFINWSQQDSSLKYWQAYKQKLVKGRASVQQRNEWVQALLLLSMPPLVDPDQLTAGDFVNPEFNDIDSQLNNRAYELYRERWQQLNDPATQNSWVADISTASADFETMVQEIIYNNALPAEDAVFELKELHAQHEQGVNVSRRLQQLTLNPTALAFLVRYAGMQDAAITEEERATLISILVQVRKERSYGRWRYEEAGIMPSAKPIALTGEFFKTAYPNPAEMNAYLEQALVPWRSFRAYRKAWQDYLEARIEQQAGVKQALEKTVEDVEGKAMTLLRDALLQHKINITGGNARQTLEAKAKWLGDLLAIDLAMNCCQSTTRIAQAMETIQNVYFSLRNNIMEIEGAALMLIDENFEAHWKWVGSYETWRSLMFVHMYPENVLLPSLRPLQTPKFRELVSKIRQQVKTDPKAACKYMHEYEEYLNDILNLTLQASACTDTEFKDSTGCATETTAIRPVQYNFALASSKKVYYSTYDDSALGYKQGMWTAIPLLENVDRIVDAVVYKVPSGERFLYVFAVFLDQEVLGNKYLAAQRFNLKTTSWEDAVLEFDLKDNVDYDNLIVQSNKDAEDQPIIICGTEVKKIATYTNYNPQTGQPAPFLGIGTNTTMNLDDYLLNLFGLPPKTLYDYTVFITTINSKGDEIDEKHYDKKIIKWVYDLKLVTSKNTLTYFGYSNILEIYKVCLLFYTSSPDIRYPNDEKKYLGSISFNYRDPGTYTYMFPSAFPFALNASSYISDINNGYKYSVGKTYPDSNSGLFRDDVCSVSDYSNHIGSVKTINAAFPNKKMVRLFYNEFDLSTNAVITKYIDLNVLNALFSDAAFSTADTAKLANIQFPYHNLTYVGPFSQYNSNIQVAPNRLSYQQSNGRRNIFIGKSGTIPISFQPIIQGNRPDLITKTNKDQQLKRKTDLTALLGPASGNQNMSSEALAYLEEAYFFLPLHLAMELHKNKFYQEALDYFRLLYDYTLPEGQRKIYYGLVQEEPASGVNTYNATNWLNEPDNPHTIARTRSNSYTRNLIISITRCLLAYADQEFTRDTAESVPRARELYETALGLIRHELIKYETQTCAEILDQLDILVDDAGWQVEWRLLKERIADINDKEIIQEILNDGNGTYPGLIAIFSNAILTWEERFKRAEAVVEEQWRNMVWPEVAVLADVTTGQSSNRIAVTLPLLAGSGLQAAARMAAQATEETITGAIARIGVEDTTWLTEAMPEAYVEPEMTVEGVLAYKQGSSGTQQANPLITLQLNGALATPYVPFASHYFCIPRNPVPYSLLLQAEMNLFKIRNCRNIAGMKRELDPYAAPTDAISGMPVIGASGQLALNGRLVIAPTQYRYAYIIERVRNLVAIAQQAEAALLSALEKRDAEYYTLLKARQDIAINKAGVRLQDLRITEAKDGIELAKLQRDKSELMEDTYNDWLSAGPNAYELAMLTAYGIIAAQSSIAALTSATMQGVQMINGANAAEAGATVALSSAALLASNPATAASAGSAYVSANVALAAASINMSALPFMLSSLAITTQANLQTIQGQYDAQYNTFYASHERRKDEWELQRAMAQQDIKIGNQQVKLGDDRLRIVGQEKVISELQLDHSEATVNFLDTKFTNVALYDWMSGILENAYSYFLQQATAMAQTAQLQLAFERQQSPAGMIQSDYWTPPTENLSFSSDTTEPADRKGITGSVRLLQDVTQLDQYAFDSNKRKLQLTKTISLAQQFPAEFALFKQTGRVAFRTPMELFDRDFPGHYLRIIRRVRTSVIALVPPVAGIKARLSTTGVSRVIVQGDYFQKLSIPRAPEAISLTSPMNATGLFELEQQSNEFLYPFEGMGVDAAWEFSMAKAANQMDYNTMADVLITLEYTALESYDYGKEVIAELDTDIRAERGFSLKNNFADQWFDLHHPEQLNEADRYKITIDLRREDFPVNLYNTKIKNVAVFLAVADDKANRENLSVTLEKATVNLTGSTVVTGGVATSNEFGLISTKTGNATTWGALKDTPVGAWTLTLGEPSKPNDPLRQLLDAGKLADIHLIVEFEGEGPAYSI